MQELLNKFSDLLKQEFNKELITEGKTLMEDIEKEFNQLREKALETFLEDPENKPEDFSPAPSEDEQKFAELKTEFKDKRKAYAERRAKEEKENLDRKLAIIKQISSITKDEENIKKAFDTFKALQEEWNGIGRVPGDRHKEVLQDYHNAVDTFYYDIKIYKDLLENDLKKNLETKQNIVKNLEVISKAETENLEENVKKYQQEWYDVGPVPRDEFEPLKARFDKALDAAYEIIKTRRAARKEELDKNLALKKGLLGKTREITEKLPNNAKAWNKATEKIIEIQQAWKQVGYGPRKENEEVWKEFRAECDTFFEHKSKFFEDFKKELSLNQTEKEALCDQAEVLKDSTDWKETSRKLIDLQKKWKNIGPAPMAFEQKLWKRFRAACDAFFEAKEKSAKELDAKFEDNYKAKLEFIEAFKGVKLPEDKQEAAKEIKSKLSEWNKLGKVPKDKITEVNNAFNSILDEKMEAIGLAKEELEHSKFTSRIQGLLQENDFEKLLQKEKRFINEKIEEFKKQAIQFENNMAFFNSSSAKKNPLLVEAEKKITATRNAIEKMENQIKYINKNMRQKIKELQANETETQNEEAAN
ncbi:DUF349 domain-containing protein [Luteibaculum oceani]|uniref:DUF349 domain-containing protein n=1 Tax=Luteibaculum oceani TaxID=1294296 RepID=A0A5C6UUI5_9FLAO|nr:DUF349 domain-containing protein [Luteibaculum oceani]TXC77032.1 DUF349 domain-containing protein [Luteibaculum oceani]